MVVAERASASDERLLFRQAVYFLGFDRRPPTATWLRALHERSARTSVDVVGDVHEHLVSRSAAVALATAGDPDRMHDFVNGMSGQGARLVDLNFWAHWIGETSSEHVDDSFLLRDSRPEWTGRRLFSHLTERLDEHSAHRPLNVRSLHTLTSCKPGLLRRLPEASAKRFADTLARLESSSRLTRVERDQVVGLLYALRIADT